MARYMVAPIILVVVLVAAMQAANATTYKVGDSMGWTSSGDYATWASGKTFNVDDVLEFDFSTGAHDVYQVSKDDYENCVKTSPIASWATGPASVTLSATGSFYYICTINSHCESGQKLAVTVSSSSSTTPSPAGSPPTDDSTTSPPPPSTGTSTSPPPPPSSASSFTAAAATSVVFGLVYAVGLMI